MTVKISSKVDEVVWAEVQEMARETHQNIAGILTEALREYLARRRIRPEVLRHLDDSLRDNQELGRLLAR